MERLDSLDKLRSLWKQGVISSWEAGRFLGVSYTTFIYKLLNYNKGNDEGLFHYLMV